MPPDRLLQLALPLEDLALQEGCLLYLDARSHIFVWSGARTVGSVEHDALRAHALEVCSSDVCYFAA